LNFVTSEVHKTFSSLFKADTPEEYKAIAKGNLTKRYAYLDQHFATHQYLRGDKLGVADIYLFVISNWLKRFNIDMA
jgi:glutathione S-transferase